MKAKNCFIFQKVEIFSLSKWSNIWFNSGTKISGFFAHSFGFNWLLGRPRIATRASLLRGIDSSSIFYYFSYFFPPPPSSFLPPPFSSIPQSIYVVHQVHNDHINHVSIRLYVCTCVMYKGCIGRCKVDECEAERISTIVAAQFDLRRNYLFRVHDL